MTDNVRNALKHSVSKRETEMTECAVYMHNGEGIVDGGKGRELERLLPRSARDRGGE